MILTAPTTGRHRFEVKCYGGGEPLYQFASSCAGRHEFEVEDNVEFVRYTVDERSWVWDGKGWVDGATFEFPKRIIPAGRRGPEPDIDPKVYKAAEEYTKAFNVRQKAVAKSFKKVTDPL